MNDDVAFILWAAYATGAVFCVAELALLALRYRNICEYLGWRR